MEEGEKGSDFNRFGFDRITLSGWIPRPYFSSFFFRTSIDSEVSSSLCERSGRRGRGRIEREEEELKEEKE